MPAPQAWGQPLEEGGLPAPGSDMCCTGDSPCPVLHLLHSREPRVRVSRKEVPEQESGSPSKPLPASSLSVRESLSLGAVWLNSIYRLATRTGLYLVRKKSIMAKLEVFIICSASTKALCAEPPQTLITRASGKHIPEPCGSAAPGTS